MDIGYLLWVWEEGFCEWYKGEYLQGIEVEEISCECVFSTYFYRFEMKVLKDRNGEEVSVGVDGFLSISVDVEGCFFLVTFGDTFTFG